MAKKKKQPRIPPGTTAQHDFDLGQLAQDQGRRRKQFVKERDSIKSATNMAVAATRATKLTGIGGPEAKQLRQEVKGRASDIKRSLPGNLAEAQRSYKDDRYEMNQQAEGLRFDRQQAIAGAIADWREKRAETAQEGLEEQQEARAETKHAVREGLRLIREETLKDDEGSPAPESPQEWMEFETALRKVEGVSVPAARKAVSRLQRRMDRGEGPIKGIGKDWIDQLRESMRR